MQVNGQFQPTIVAFCCNWCSYAGADLSGTNRLQYPANVKIIRIPCSCRLNPMFILRAFQRGADGVHGLRGAAAHLLGARLGRFLAVHHLRGYGGNGCACGDAQPDALCDIHALLVHGIKPPDPYCGFQQK